MTTFMQHLNDDLNYELKYIVKEVKKTRPGYTKTQCIEDIIKLSLKDKDNLIKEVLIANGGN